MSYDLFLLSRPGSDVSSDSVARFLSERDGYTIEDGQAVYENEQTGVYFIVDLDGIEADDETPEAVALAVINYCRPSFFIREAEEELSALVQALGLRVHDPQGGMQDGEYSPRLFVDGWTHANRQACEAAGLGDVHRLPASTLSGVWEWNRRAPHLQDELDKSQDVFVPSIMLFALGTRVVRVAVWPDGIPIAVPDVDYLFIIRERLAPKGFLKRKPDQGLVSFDSVKSMFEAHRSKRDDGLFVLDYETPPADVESFVTSLPVQEDGFEALSMDQVIDAE